MLNKKTVVSTATMRYFNLETDKIFVAKILSTAWDQNIHDYNKVLWRWCEYDVI